MIRQRANNTGRVVGQLICLLALLTPMASGQTGSGKNRSDSLSPTAATAPTAATNYTRNRDGNFYINFSLGYATQDFDKLNQNITFSESFLSERIIQDANPNLEPGEEPAIPPDLPDWNTFSGAYLYNLEAGYHLSNRLSLGLGLNYQHSEVDNFFRNVARSIGDDTELRTWTIGTVLIWQPVWPGWLFTGGELGMGFAEYRNELRYDYNLAPWASKSFRSTYNNSAISAGLFTEVRQHLSRFLDFSCRLGYRHNDLGEFTGKMRRIGYDEIAGTLYSADGEALNLDFSGFYLKAGFRFDLQLPVYLR